MPEVREAISQMSATELSAAIQNYLAPYDPQVSQSRAVHLLHRAAEFLGPHTAWRALTDEDRKRAFESLPDMLDGFLKTWGWLHFAIEIERICREKNRR